MTRSERILLVQGWGLFDAGICSDGLPAQGWGTGFGLSSDCGLIGLGEAASGKIAHALRMTGPPTLHGTRWRLPARKSDQNGQGPAQEGMRLVLDATDREISVRTVPGDDPRHVKLLHAICVALRDYGAIVCDGSGDTHGWAVLVEGGDWTAYRPFGGPLGNVIRDPRADQTGDGLDRRPTDGIPWNHVRVLARSTFS